MRILLSRVVCLVTIVWVAAITGLHAQQAPLTPTALTPVPRLMWFNGTFRPADNLPVAPVENITVAVYRDREGGDAVWRETQNVAMDAVGRYSLLIGSTFPDGMPLALFTSGEPCWIGITVNRAGEVEQPRVHEASVPYALKAADAETLGGLPASAYLRAPAAEHAGVGERESSSAAMPTDPDVTMDAVVQPGTTNFLAKYVNGADVGNSAVYEAGGSVGIGTTTPLDSMHLRFTNTGGTATGLAVQNLGNTAASYSGMLFYDQFGVLGQFQGFNNVTHEYRINNIATSGSINFMLGSTSRFFVATNGRIGIGTTAPQHALHVVGEAVRVQGNDTGIFPRFSLNFTGAAVNEGRWQNYAAPNRLSFTALNDAENAEAFWLLVNRGVGTAISSVSFPSGNIGVGTLVPAAKLEIQGGADGDGTSDPKAMAFGYRFGGFRHWIRTRHSIIPGTGNAIDFFVNDHGDSGGSTAPGVGSVHAMTLDGGSVGIGTSSPKTKLHVAGGSIYIAQPNSLVITSPNGNCWFITVSDAGALSSITLPCP